MRGILLISLAFGFISVGCTDLENQDSSSEISCANATGIWTLSSVSCDGATVADVGTLSVYFDTSGASPVVTQVEGPAACTTTSDWDLLIDSSSSIQLSGNGNLRCSADGATTSSCSTAENSCDESIDISGQQNNYEVCAISNSSMSLMRTVSSTNDPAGNSYCAEGQLESVTLLQTATEPPAVAVLDIADPDPANFGSITTGNSNQLTLVMSNSGQATATAISPSGLAAPFTFLGGSYPGTGGNCSSSLASGATCNMIVDFSPTTLNTFNDSLSISYDDGSVAQSFTHGVTGTGVSSGSSCDGTSVGGFCWYMSGMSTDCITACSSHGGTDSAGALWSGSGAADASNCDQILDAVIGPGTTTETACSTPDIGCAIDFGGNPVWCPVSPTSADNGSFGFNRACACNN